MIRQRIDRFSSDRDLADRSIGLMVEHCVANIASLRTVRMGRKHITALLSFRDMLTAGEEFTPGQRSYLERIYELTFQGRGFEACGTHVDRKRRGLRFG